jgi:hypothetical protein
VTFENEKQKETIKIAVDAEEDPDMMILMKAT